MGHAEHYRTRRLGKRDECPCPSLGPNPDPAKSPFAIIAQRLVVRIYLGDHWIISFVAKSLLPG